MRHWKTLAVAASLVFSNLAAAAALRASDAALRERPPSETPALESGKTEPLYVVRVYVNSQFDTLRLVNGGWDVLEARGKDYLLVMADEATIKALRDQKFTVEIDQTIDGSALNAPFTYYGGYRTVAEHYAHLDQVVAAYPALAAQIDYGDSWRKANGLANGHDLRAICITNRQPGDCALNPNSAKPRFLLMAEIHARELTTSEMAWRWIDYLTQNYNVDADVTMLLDSTELWVIPLVNPDGRQIVETGGSSPYLQRKNARDTGACSNPPTASNQDGVDLNRNASTDNYGGAGTSTSVCTQTYRGTGPASEPEEQAMESLFAQLFQDTKGPARTDPAAANTKGIFITLHTYGNLVLLPYGDATTGGYAPNDAALRHLAFRMSNYNGYQTGTGDEILYPTTGTTDDWVYGKLGVPGFTFEMGPTSGTCSGFTPAYSCQDSTFWPLNRPAFLAAARNAREPYLSPAGPVAASLGLSAATVPQGTASTLTANLNDNLYGNAAGSVGRPTAQAIADAEYYIDTPPWAGGTPIPMSASDGAFNATSENATASVSTASLSAGRHTLFVRGRDAGNTWGAVSAIFLTVTVAGPTPTPTNTPTVGPTPTPTNTPAPTNTPTATPSSSTQTFASAASVSVPGSGSASPYPSSISVSGMANVTSKIVVRLKGLSHTYPDDLDVLLIGPGGQKLLLMSDAGGGRDINGVTFTFDDAAAATLANSSQLATGTYRPSNYGTGDTFAAPAPAGPYSSALSTFTGANPNGTWSLYVVDDSASDSGTMTGGWELTITSGTLLKSVDVAAVEEGATNESLGEDAP
ncbi:MAG: M14 family zinc carboxypeptidase [Thermoflexales bacterium]